MNVKIPQYVKDLIYLFIVIISAYFIAGHLDIIEFIVEFSKKYEKYEVDEIITVVFFVFMFCLVIFSYRRWSETRHLSKLLYERNKQLEHALKETKEIYAKFQDTAQIKMIRQEKMASIGLLAAGVAHEINNPVGFITSNLCTLSKYIERLSEYISTQKKVIQVEFEKDLEELNEKLKIDFITEDAKNLINESLDGADRVSKIVQSLKTFSRVDETEHKSADINECLENTLNIVWNELKYKATVNKDYGDLPLTKCYPQQLNQVFMNILVNAAHAIENRGEIGIKTWQQGDSIIVSISDTGSGIAEDNLSKLFDPFFTTKEVGKGTGLGLSIVYEIIQKHAGDIVVNSEIGKGTTFTTFTTNLPIVQASH